MPVLSRSRRVIYIHIPKTAGTAVTMFFYQRGFIEADDWRDWYRRNDHRSAAFVRDALARDPREDALRWDDFFRFSIVRNPFDRMISLYNYKRRSPGQRFHDASMRFDFPDFVAHFVESAEGELDVRDQLSWLVDEAEQFLVDRVLRLEQLGADWQRLCIDAGLPQEPLKEINRTRGPSYDHDAWYDDASRRLVERVFARDLDRFDYDYRPRRASRPCVSGSVVQFCPTLGSYCGIATYTEMLAAARGLAAAREPGDVDFDATRVLHLQHEFGIVGEALLKDLADRCRTSGTRLVVTMHRVERTEPLVLVSIYLTAVRRALARRLARLRTRSGTPADTPAPAPTRGPIPPARRLGPVGRVLRPAREFARRRRMQQQLLATADRLVVHSREAADELRRQGAHGIRVMDHPLEPFPTSPTLRSEEDGRLHVGYFGFLSGHKDLQRLVRACSRIPDVRLHLLASIPQQSGGIGSAEDLVEWLQQYPWVELDLRFQPLGDIVRDLSRNDVNVYLSNTPRHGFSTSGSIRQYLAAQRPVVANRSVMTSDLEDIVTLLPDERPATIARFLQTCDDDVERIRAYCETHTWADMPDVYDDLVPVPSRVTDDARRATPDPRGAA